MQGALLADSVTVTRTTRTATDTREIRSGLSAVALELNRLRNDESTSLAALVEVVRSLEERLAAMETVTVETASQVDAANRELERERERFQQLWQAYKSQEDELAGVKRQLGVADEGGRAVKDLQGELARLRELAAKEAEFERSIRENQALHVEVESLNQRLRGHEAVEAENATLREAASRAERLADVDEQLQKERERLAKLYKVYEERAADLRDLQGRLDKWEAWFVKMEPHLSFLCRGSSEAPRV